MIQSTYQPDIYFADGYKELIINFVGKHMAEVGYRNYKANLQHVKRYWFNNNRWEILSSYLEMIK